MPVLLEPRQRPAALFQARQDAALFASLEARRRSVPYRAGQGDFAPTGHQFVSAIEQQRI